LNQCKIAWNPITYPPPFSFWKDFTFPEFIHRGWGGGGNWDDLNHFAFCRVQYVQYTATDWSEPPRPDPVHTRFPRHVYFYFHFLSISFSSAEWWED
jgi:hypothetical protein